MGHRTDTESRSQTSFRDIRERESGEPRIQIWFPAPECWRSNQIIERYYVTHLFLLDCSMAESLELAESEIELKTVLANVCERLGYSTLRPEQSEAVSAFAGGKDVFVALSCTQPC